MEGLYMSYRRGANTNVQASAWLRAEFIHSIGMCRMCWFLAILRSFFLEILPLYSQYIYSISIYVVKINHLFHTNNQTHSIHTIFKTNLHPPTANLTKFQKALHYSAIKIFNNLLHEIKNLANDILPFQNALKRFLLTNSFYNSKEYFN